MTAYFLRRVVQIFLMAIVVAFVAFSLLYLSPGGPLQQVTSLQSTTLRLDAGAVDRVIKRYDLDIDMFPRFTRWLIGFPSGPVNVGGQDYFGATQIGCAEEGAAQVTYADGRTETINCKRPIYLNDLKERPVSAGILRLDFGLSQQILRERPVWDLIESRIGFTLLLMGISTFLAIGIAVPVGIYSAVKQYSRFDYAMTTITFIGSGFPTVFLGLLGVIIFSLLFQDLGLPYLPPNMAESARDVVIPLFGNVVAGSIADRAWHLALPAGVLTFVNLSAWTRFVRSSMLEVLKQDYVRTARAKGLRENAVILKHALRNALIPFVTLLAGVLPTLFAGAIITETIFSWPGMGKLFVNALTAGDYPVALAFVMITTFLTLIGYLMTDLLYTVVDPRIRLT